MEDDFPDDPALVFLFMDPMRLLDVGVVVHLGLISPKFSLCRQELLTQVPGDGILLHMGRLTDAFMERGEAVLLWGQLSKHHRRAPLRDHDPRRQYRKRLMFEPFDREAGLAQLDQAAVQDPEVLVIPVVSKVKRLNAFLLVILPLGQEGHDDPSQDLRSNIVIADKALFRDQPSDQGFTAGIVQAHRRALDMLKVPNMVQQMVRKDPGDPEHPFQHQLLTIRQLQIVMPVVKA